MINVIRMDLYRMFKSKITWLILFTILFFSVTSLSTVHSEYEYFSNLTLESMLSEGYTQERAEAYLADPLYVKGYEFDVFFLFESVIQRAIIGLLIAVFAVIFTGAETNTGYIKNIAGQTSIRHRTILSKMVVLFLYTSMIMLFYFIITLICSRLLFGYINIGMYSTEDMLLFISSQIFLNFVFGCVVMCGSELIRNQVISMAVGVILTTGIFVVPMNYLDDFFKFKEFSFTSLLITPYLENLTVDSAEYGSAWIVGIAFLVVGTLLSIVSMKKRDIR